MLTLVLGNDMLHLPHRLHIIVLLTDSHKIIKPMAYLLIVILADLGYLNLLIKGRLGDFLVVEDFLIQFLAIAQARELNLHIGGAGQTNHAAG